MSAMWLQHSFRFAGRTFRRHATAPRKPLTAPPIAGYTCLLVGLITTAEAAAILKISPVRVRHYINSCQLASEKRGRDHLLNQEEVERFNRQGRRPAGRPSKPSCFARIG